MGALTSSLRFSALTVRITLQMADEAHDVTEQFEKASNTPMQTWLLAAGTSFMYSTP
jgi:hypothetical protein